MLVNSPEFLLFLPIVFGLYWFVGQRNLRAQSMRWFVDVILSTLHKTGCGPQYDITVIDNVI